MLNSQVNQISHFSKVLILCKEQKEEMDTVFLSFWVAFSS